MASFATGWTPLTLQNGWAVVSGSGYPPAAAYRIDGQGVVWLRGMISGGANGSVCCTLPAGARPGYEAGFAISESGQSAANGIGLANGELLVYYSGASSIVLLDAVHFLAEN